MNRYFTPLEILNLYFSNGASRGKAANKLWRRFNDLFTWDNLIKRGFQADMAPFLYFIIKKALPRMSEISPECKDIANRIPENVLPWLKACHKASLFRNMVLLEELKRVSGTLSKSGINAIPLKGGDLAENVYEDIACRPMNDLDLLVQDCNKEQTFRIISSLGYNRIKSTLSNRELHEAFIREVAGQKVIIEVHSCLVKKKFRKRFNLKEVFELGYIPFHFQLLYLSWHTMRHGVMRFMWLCDLAELFRHRDTPIDWERFICTANEYNVKQETGFVLYLASKLLDVCLLKQYPMEPDRFRRFILDKIFLKGKGHLSGQSETRQRFIMSLALMKPLDMMMLLPSYIARVTFENWRNLSPIGTVQRGHK